MLLLVKCRGETELSFSLLRFTEKSAADSARGVEVVIFPQAHAPSCFDPLWQPRQLSELNECCPTGWKALTRKRFRLFPRRELDPVRYIQLVKCLAESASFTATVVRGLLEARSAPPPDIICLVIASKNQPSVDLLWYRRIVKLVNDYIHLYETMAWLSTLGGAYSAMGDYGDRYAAVAKKISVKQLKLAMSLGDPTQVCRCLIFLAMSAMQYGMFTYSKRLLLKQWQFAQSSEGSRDPRLKNMILGTWKRLKHERAQHKSSVARNSGS